MSTTLRLAVRDWDYLTPLALNDITSPDLHLHLTRVNALPDDLAAEPDFDAAEMSFSRYALSQATSPNPDIVGIPYFLMRAFRHRCIITTTHSPLTSVSQLRGKRIGLTGWQDSGNTWTRAILRREGIAIEDNQWFLSRLTAAQPMLAQRGDGYAEGKYIHEVPDERPLIELLHAGELDAVFTAFMPEHFFAPDSGLRQLIPDFVDQELVYYQQVHYVPGIHIIGMKRSVFMANPQQVTTLCQLLDRSVALWQQKREKYAETTPWLIDELRRVAHHLPAGWSDNGFAANQSMIAEFTREQYHQKLVDKILTPAQLFPEFS